jgi:hypothetical protein
VAEEDRTDKEVGGGCGKTKVGIGGPRGGGRARDDDGGEVGEEEITGGKKVFESSSVGR